MKVEVGDTASESNNNRTRLAVLYVTEWIGKMNGYIHRMLRKNHNSRIKNRSRGRSELQHTQKGVNQDDPVSSNLFNAVLAEIFRSLR